MIRYRFPAMGNQVLILLDSHQESHKAPLARAAQWFQEWEQALSRFRPESELCRLNRRAGQPTAVSETLWQVFQASLDAYQLSGGLVTPAVLPSLEIAGYTRSFADLPYHVAPSNDIPQQTTDLRQVQFDPAQRTLQLPAGMRLDFGGVAKGWAAHQTMLRLQHLCPKLVDAGGDIAISDLRSDGQPWPIGLADPLNDLRDLEQLRVGRGGVATSGRDRHRWRQNGAARHHLIDPRSGQPAETDILSATVIAADVLAAETAAKTVLILGSRRGLDWLEKQPGLAGIVVLEDGTVIYSRDFQPAVRSMA